MWQELGKEEMVQALSCPSAEPSRGWTEASRDWRRCPVLDPPEKQGPVVDGCGWPQSSSSTLDLPTQCPPRHPCRPEQQRLRPW